MSVTVPALVEKLHHKQFQDLVHRCQKDGQANHQKRHKNFLLMPKQAGRNNTVCPPAFSI